MHGSLDKPGKTEQRIYGSRAVRLIAIPVLVLTALIGFVVSHPAAFDWLSRVVKAEFSNIDRGPDRLPVQTAEPGKEIKSGKAH